MKNLEIIWTVDTYECNHDGCSGGYAEGFIAFLDGELLCKFEPHASCWDSDTISGDDAYKVILEKLGINLTIGWSKGGNV